MRRKPINLDKLPGNAKMPQGKTIEPVVKGAVKSKRSGGLAGKIRDAGNALFSQILIPSLQATIADFLHGGVNILFYENNQTAIKSAPKPYNKMYRTPGIHTRSRRQTAPVQTVYDDIFFEFREDAELVLGSMIELIAQYGVATIGDLYSLVGRTSNYTHERWGWDDLRQSRVHFTSDGYVISFPEPEYFK